MRDIYLKIYMNKVGFLLPIKYVSTKPNNNNKNNNHFTLQFWIIALKW